MLLSTGVNQTKVTKPKGVRYKADKTLPYIKKHHAFTHYNAAIDAA